MRDRSVVKSSVTPSAKYCCSLSSLRLVNGRTTIDSRGATAGGEVEAAAGAADISIAEAIAGSDRFPAEKKLAGSQNHHPIPAIASAAAAAAPAIFRPRKVARFGKAGAVPAASAPGRTV